MHIPYVARRLEINYARHISRSKSEIIGIDVSHIGFHTAGGKVEEDLHKCGGIKFGGM